jgi:hypothetical protein
MVSKTSFAEKQVKLSSRKSHEGKEVEEQEKGAGLWRWVELWRRSWSS